MNLQKPAHKPVPIIDLFAGPGGLGEGFSSIQNQDGSYGFRIGLSIEKDFFAHRTLTLRSVFRHLRDTKDLMHYFKYVRGEIDEQSFRAVPVVARAFEAALNETKCIELGKDDPSDVDKLIHRALEGERDWLLIGGPPCQAYSLAGRSRRKNDATFESDVKHFLYREYLRIIKAHRPAIFVMENVKGLLTSKHSGDFMFQKILTDLKGGDERPSYEIRSFVKHGVTVELEGNDFVIEAEKYGIPQARHRVILLGVRRDLNFPTHQLIQPVQEAFTVREAIGDLPRLRSRVSVSDETIAHWHAAVSIASNRLNSWNAEDQTRIMFRMQTAAKNSLQLASSGTRFIEGKNFGPNAPKVIRRWFTEDGPGGCLQHEARSHMELDLCRYMFAATYAAEHGVSPKLDQFPHSLLPLHKNAKRIADGGRAPFMDRFRVQCANAPSTTVVSHIAKDGHYYIHYDPAQCRSLTVREAARLQTFPDNYYFEGNRTQQYTQVGNAVPPLLASKLAEVVHGLFLTLHANSSENRNSS